MSSSSSPLIAIGVLTRPHGIKGEIRVDYYAESLDFLRGELFLQAGREEPRKVRIEGVRRHQGVPLIRLEGVPDRTAAELFRGQTLLVPEDSLPELDDESVYLHALLGLAVYLEGASTPLGTLEDVLFHGEQEVWEIRTPDGKEIFFPAVPEFVIDIDLEAERIRIAPPEGLLELYL